jgi:hypothetical protein
VETLMAEGQPSPTMHLWLEHIDELVAITKDLEGMHIMAPDTPHDKEAAKIVAFKFVQAVRTLHAIVALCKVGDSSNAMILARVMLESFIDAIFLMKHPREVWRYLEEAADLEAKLEAGVMKHDPNGEAPVFGTHPRPTSAALRQQFGKLADEHSTVRAWRKLNLRTRAERTEHPQILFLYEMIYPFTSAYAHGSSTIVMDYLRGPIDGETGFHFAYAPAEAEVDIALNWAGLMFLGFLACMDQLMNLGLRERLQRLERREVEIAIEAQNVILARSGLAQWRDDVISAMREKEDARRSSDHD